jgi:NAD(P)-dependent dehydrogenase (short-subunit alcohol dehydrogenase family)
MLLEGKACLVTGGAAGIGYAIAREAVAEGARVMIADVNAARATEAARELGCESIAVDLSVKAQATAAAEAMIDRFGRIDALINSHGITTHEDTLVTVTDEAVLDRILAVNLKANFYLCGAAIPHMRSRGGAIVNIASVGAIAGYGGAAYTASKGALVALGRQIAYQEAANRIRCVSLLPGHTDTEMVRVSQGKQGMAPYPNFAGSLQRMASPEEISGLAIFLVSDRGAFITGATYVVDGGVSQY